MEQYLLCSIIMPCIFRFVQSYVPKLRRLALWDQKST